MRRHLRTSVAMACALGLVFAAAGAATSAAAQIELGVSVNVDLAPPPLPDYDQPASPEDGYIWTPGYWGWDGDAQDYYWVPGTWVEPPSEGLLWTPAYWAFGNGQFGFVPGYWGETVGYYGGIDYGYGYGGDGYEGGRWQDHHFHYNSNVNNVVGLHVTNVYVGAAARRAGAPQVSYNGGPGGVAAHATTAQQAAFRAPHVAETPLQTQHAQMAAAQPDLRAKANHGAPRVAATSRPAAFAAPVPANAGSVHRRPAEPPQVRPEPVQATDSAPRQPAGASRTSQDKARPTPEMEAPAPPAAARGPGPAAAPRTAPPQSTPRPAAGEARPPAKAPAAKPDAQQPRGDDKPR